MKMTFEFDDQMVFDAVVAQCTRYMIEKRCSGMVGTITKDVAQQVKSEVVDSGLIEKRVEEVVKRVENSLMARVNKQFTPVMDEAVNIVAKQFDEPKCNYSLCFSTGVNENLALWYLYSGMNGKGGRIRFTSNKVKKVTNFIKSCIVFLQYHFF